MPEPLPKTRALTNWKPRKSETEWKNEKNPERMNFDLKVQGLLRERWTKKDNVIFALKLIPLEQFNLMTQKIFTWTFNVENLNFMLGFIFRKIMYKGAKDYVKQILGFWLSQPQLDST